MASPPNDRRPSDRRRRIGRIRQARLPPGPSIQFVIASHPDDFRSGQTMRHIRSHVMYRHREQGGSSASDENTSREGSSVPFMPTTRTPSPTRARSDGTQEQDGLSLYGARRPQTTTRDLVSPASGTTGQDMHPLRSLLARILSSVTAASIQGGPPALQEGDEFPLPAHDHAGSSETLDDLKHAYIQETTFFVYDLSWMQRICGDPLSFLSHVTVTCVYQDQMEFYLIDSEYTLHARAGVLAMIKTRSDIEDAYALAISHLLVSELGNLDEQILDFYLGELMRIVSMRAGISGTNTAVENFARIIMTTFCIMQGRLERGLWQDTASVPTSITPSSLLMADGHISSVLGNMTQLYGQCSLNTWDILRDMEDLIQVVLTHHTEELTDHLYSHGRRASADAQVHQIYSRLLLRPCMDELASPDWIYECCRLAALVFCGALVHNTTLADIASTTYTNEEQTSTLLSALHAAVEQTDVRSCWGEMRLLFLWICLTGASASWASAQSHTAVDGSMIPSVWTRKCFALYAIRAAASCVPEETDATIHSLQSTLQIRDYIDRIAAPQDRA